MHGQSPVDVATGMAKPENRTSDLILKSYETVSRVLTYYPRARDWQTAPSGRL